MTEVYRRRTSPWRSRRFRRKQIRYLLLSLGLASLASAIFCLVLWGMGQSSGGKRALDPFESGHAIPIMPAR